MVDEIQYGCPTPPEGRGDSVNSLIPYNQCTATGLHSDRQPHYSHRYLQNILAKFLNLVKTITGSREFSCCAPIP